MRILLVNKYAHVTGGADRHFLDLASLLTARGHAVRLLSTVGAPPSEIGGVFVPAPVTHRAREGIHGWRKLAVAGRAMWNRSAASATRQLLSDFKPDVLHAHKLYPQLSAAPVVCAHQAGIPIVQTAHDYEFVAAHFEDDAGGWLDRRDSRLSFRALTSATFAARRGLHVPRVTRWITSSRFMASAYRRRGISCRVIEYFVFEHLERPLPRESRRGVVFIGRLTEAKGVRDVVELARRDPRLDVTIAGDGELKGLVAEAARAHANLDYVGFLDTSAAQELVRRAQVVLVPSRWSEPGGLVALEGMAAGTPVVAYANGGLGQYVAGAGAVVPEDLESLVTVTQAICDDAYLWDLLSRAGLQRVRSVHNPQRCVAMVEAVYYDALSASPRGSILPVRSDTN